MTHDGQSAGGWGPTTPRGRAADAAAGGDAGDREASALASVTYGEALASYASVGSSAASGPLLEYFRKTVTPAANISGDEFTRNEAGPIGPGATHYRLSICGCDCWFCPDCCGVKGYKLRARLIPVLESFTSTMMITLTVDPTLFTSPLAAYRYIRERRCVSRTMQDLRRAGFVHSGRYFYVVEWQRRTEQVHYHVLCDATFVPWGFLRDSWSKHRPPEAGPVIGKRPAFGTVRFSKRYFVGGAVHAARYATKYLVKTPADGFPAWVLEQGRDGRIKRYGISRGFWGQPAIATPTPGSGEADDADEGEATERAEGRTYAKRIEECGTTYNAFVVREVVDPATGEVSEEPQWIGQLRADEGVLQHIDDGQNPKRRRRDLAVASAGALMRIVESVSHGPTYWVRGGSLHNQLDRSVHHEQCNHDEPPGSCDVDR